MTTKEVEKRLSNDGWYVVAVIGSHKQFRHATKPGKVTVPQHRGDVPKGTLNSIWKQAGLK